MNAALQVAQLALKHRGNKNGGQRIIVIIGSAISDSSDTLVRLGKKLRKSGIALDLISIGDEVEHDKLEALLKAVNDKNKSSHYVHVPVGGGMMADVLVSTPIFFGGAGDDGVGAVEGQAAPVGGAATGAGGGGGGGGGGAFALGVDPNVDPELYEAIQMSLREQQERDAAASSQKPAAAVGPGTPATQNSNNNTPSQSAGGVVPMDTGDDVSEEMKAAIALSMQQAAGQNGDDLYSDNGGVKPMDTKDDDEAEALKMSLALQKQSESEDALKAALKDHDFVKDLFGDLPVDLDDAAIKDALQTITKDDKKDEKKEEGKESDPKKKK